MVTDIIQNWPSICTHKHFVAIGSTRKVYRWNDYVIKVNLHKMGFVQSKHEFEIYKYMLEANFAHLFAQTYYVDERICLQQYFPVLPLVNNQSYDIHERTDFWRFPEGYEECIKLLDEKFDIFDIQDSGNYGVNEKQELVFIDYRMSKKLYNDAWVPAAENGEVPQLEVHACDTCGMSVR